MTGLADSLRTVFSAAPCHSYPRTTIWAPWNLRCDDRAAIANEAIIYESLAGISRYPQHHLLAGISMRTTHDHDDPNFIVGNNIAAATTAVLPESLNLSEDAEKSMHRNSMKCFVNRFDLRDAASNLISKTIAAISSTSGFIN